MNYFRTLAMVGLVVLLSKPVDARQIQPVEITPKNCEENGLKIRICFTLENGIYDVLVVFDKLPPFLQTTSHYLDLVIRDAHHQIAQVTLKPFDPYNQGNTSSYSFFLAPNCVPFSKLCLYEGTYYSGRSFGIELSKFKPVEPINQPSVTPQ